MKLKRLLATLGIVVLSTSMLAGCAPKPEAAAAPADAPKQAEAAKYVFKLGHSANEENTWHLGAVKFAELVKERSNGQIEIKVYPNEQLGKEMDVISGIQGGTVDMTVTGESLQNWVPEAAMLAVPYAIRDSEHLTKVAGGEIGKEIEQKIAEKTGLIPLFYYERGPRDLTSNREIKTPDDLKGLVTRVPNVPMFIKVWETLGAKPTPMAFSEVFTALQQNTIEAQENPLALIESASFFEVQKFVNKTEHVRSWIYVVVGEKQFKALPEDLQKVMIEAGQEAQAYEHQLFLESEEKIAKKLEEKGMTFVEVDKEAFAAKAKEAVMATLKPGQQAIYQRILDTK